MVNTRRGKKKESVFKGQQGARKETLKFVVLNFRGCLHNRVACSCLVLKKPGGKICPAAAIIIAKVEGIIFGAVIEAP